MPTHHQPQQFRKWRNQFRKDVANASTRPKDAVPWIIKVEKAGSMEELEDSEGFDTLDFKLSTAFGKILQGPLQKEVQLLEEKYIQRGTLLNGRQICWLVYRNYKLETIEKS